MVENEIIILKEKVSLEERNKQYNEIEKNLEK